MRALIATSAADARATAWADVPRPVPGPSGVLVAVKAVGLNRADLTYGDYHFQGLPCAARRNAGIELAGEVVEAGSDVDGVRVGDRIMAMANDAAAEFAVVDHRALLKVPARLSWVEAAAVPVAFLTAHDALVTHAALRPGESVLVQAASSGVGTAAIQVARARGAGPIFGTAGSRQKLRDLQRYGLDCGIDYLQQDFARVIETETGGRGVDVIFDMVGASAFDPNLACAATGARILNVGRLGGRRVELDLTEVAQRRLQLLGVSFRTRSLEQISRAIAAFEADCMVDLASGTLRPVVDRVFPAAEASLAYAYLSNARHIGKTVLSFAC